MTKLNNFFNKIYKGLILSTECADYKTNELLSNFKSVEQKEINGTNYFVLDEKFYIPQFSKNGEKPMKIMKDGKLVDLL